MKINFKYISIVVLGLFLAQIIYTVVSMGGSVYGDEHVFLKITEQLPKSSTTADWLLVERPDLVYEAQGWQFYHSAYDTEAWVHPLLPNYLVYPLSKVADLHNPMTARLVPLILTIVAVFLIVDVLRRRFGLASAGFAVLPFIFSQQLLGNGLWLYYDCFMWLFFALSLWLVFVKPNSRWLYVSLVAMLMSKETGLFLLIPLLMAYYFKVHSFRSTLLRVLPALALVGWYVHLWVATGDVLYLWRHWANLRVAHPNMDYLAYYLLNWGGVLFLILTLPGMVANIKNKELWAFVALYCIALWYGINGNFVPYQMFGTLFAGMIFAVLTMRLLFSRQLLEAR